jgi:hypothetical protein
VPPLPPGYVARAELDRLRTAVLAGDDGAVGIAGGARALGLQGQGGIGKTVLACALARDREVRRRFPDGVLWVTIGERGDVVAAQMDLLARLGVAHPEVRAATRGLALLRAALAERRCLLVVDDVWSAAVAGAFRATGPRGRVLYTTRDPAVLERVGARVEPIDVLSADAARRLLAGLAGVAVLPAEAEPVLEATGRVALAVALVGAAVGRGGRSWAEVAEELQRGGETFLDHPYANAFKAMQVGLSALDDELRDAYGSLAVYPQDAVIPVAAVARWWSALWGIPARQTRGQLEALAARELLSLKPDGIGCHDLQGDFMLLRADELTVLHGDLLAVYRALLPPGSTAWRDLPPQEPYIWDYLLYHLRAAGDGEAIAAVATDLAYLARRSFASGPHAAEADLQQAARVHPEDPAIGWLLRLFFPVGASPHRSADGR